MSIESQELEKIARFAPMTVQKRRATLNEIVEEIKKRHFKNLDENLKESVEKIEEIVRSINPDFSDRTIRDYAKASIRKWKLLKENDEV